MAHPPTRLSRFQAGRPTDEGYGWDGVQTQVYKSGQECGREWGGRVRQGGGGDRAEAKH